MNRDHSGSAAQEDNVAFFDALYREHHRVLHAFLMGQSSNRELASDLLQETFIRVWRHIEKIQRIPSEQRRYYLFTLTRNLLHDHRRRGIVRQHLHVDLSSATEMKADSRYDPATAFSATEMQSAIDTAICGLPTDLRTVLALHLLGEMTSPEIGAMLGIPAGTVRSRISQARQRIAAKIGLSTTKREQENQRDAGK